MPNEILTEICSHVRDGDDTESRGKEWLRAVRLTCKKLHVPATVEFGKRFLTAVPVMAARESLETLFEICKHPLIGPQVTEIQFYGRRYCSNSFSDLSDEVEHILDNRNLRWARKFTRQLRSVLDFLDEEFDIERYQGSFTTAYDGPYLNHNYNRWVRPRQKHKPLVIQHQPSRFNYDTGDVPTRPKPSHVCYLRHSTLVSLNP